MLKKKRFNLLFLLLAVVLLIPNIVQAVDNDVRVYLDGELLKEQGFIENGRTFIPARALFEKRNAVVKWDDKDKKVIINYKDNNIILSTKEDEYSEYNNIEVDQYDSISKVIKGITYIPVRLTSYLLGDDIKWDGKTNSVYITTNNNKGLTLDKAHKTLLKLPKDNIVKYIFSPYENYAGKEKDKINEDYYMFYENGYRENGELDYTADSNILVSKNDSKVYKLYLDETGKVKIISYSEYYKSLQ